MAGAAQAWRGVILAGMVAMLAGGAKAAVEPAVPAADAAAIDALKQVGFAPPGNAALVYLRLFMTDKQIEPLQVMLADVDGAKPLDPALISKLESVQDYVEQLLRATRIKECDFGVDYEQGYLALLPHLGYVRKNARLLAADAQRLLAAGDEDGVEARLTAVFRLGEHMRTDRILISSLVSIAIEELGASRIGTWLDQGKISARLAGRLVALLETVDVKDPGNLTGAMRGERAMFRASMARTLASDDPGHELAEFVSLAASGQDIAALLEAMTPGELKGQIEQAEKAFAAMEAAWQAEDPKKALAEATSRVNNMEFGVLATAFLPSVEKSKSAELKLREKLVSLKERLKATAEGGAAPAGAGSR